MAKETNFMRFWRELNDWMILSGEDEVYLGVARHLYELFGDGGAYEASDHEVRLIKEVRQAELEEA